MSDGASHRQRVASMVIKARRRALISASQLNERVQGCRALLAQAAVDALEPKPMPPRGRRRKRVGPPISPCPPRRTARLDTDVGAVRRDSLARSSRGSQLRLEDSRPQVEAKRAL